MSRVAVAMSPSAPAPGTDRYKEVFGHFCTGVTAVTSVHEGRPVGFTCQSFSALSLDPQLALLSVQRSSTTWPLIRQEGRFVVNVLSAGQDSVALRLAQRGGDKFAEIAWTASASGMPLLDGGLAWVECELLDEIEAGDHHVVVAAVTDMGTAAAGEPLLYFRGDFVPPRAEEER